MLKWKSYRPKPNFIYPEKRTRNYNIELQNRDRPEDYLDDFKEVLVRFVLKKSLPLSGSVSWDVIRIEYWFDAGVLYIYPAAEPFKERIDKSCVQVHVPQAYNYWTCLADSELDDNTFTKKVTAMNKKYTKILLRAMKEIDWVAQVNNILNKKIRKLYFWVAEEDGPLHEETYFRIISSNKVVLFTNVIK